MIRFSKGLKDGRRMYARITDVRKSMTEEGHRLIMPLYKGGGIYPVKEISWSDDLNDMYPKWISIVAQAPGGGTRHILLHTNDVDIEVFPL